MSMHLIGLAGQEGVGKTSVSLLLLKLLPRYHRASFGDLVKQAVGARFRLRTETLYQDLDEFIELTEERAREGLPEGMPVRRLLEWFEHEVMGAQNPNHWVMLMDKWLRLCEEKKIPGMIIDDVAFPNEANLIKRRRGLLVKLEPYPDYGSPMTLPQGRNRGDLATYKGFNLIFSPAHGEASLENVAKAIAMRIE